MAVPTRYFTRQRGETFLLHSAIGISLLGLAWIAPPIGAPMWIIHTQLAAAQTLFDDIPPPKP